MPHEMNPAISFDNVVKPRIHGRSAVRIKLLAARTGMSENQVANRVADAGIAAVEKQFKNVVRLPTGK